MLQKQIVGALACFMMLMLTAGAQAATLYDQNITPDVIFGAGNANGSWTVDQNNDVELGLRGKVRHDLTTGAPENTFNSNGDGTYTFDAGVPAGQSSPTGVWSFEWSINTDLSGSADRDLDDLTYQLWIDQDAGIGASYVVFDVVNCLAPSSTCPTFWDHAIGDNSTGNGGGTSATDTASYLNLIGNNNVAQNSWKAEWFIGTYDPTVDGTFEFMLKAFDESGELASTSMTIIQGAGAVVPIPAAAWLFGSALLGLGVIKRRKA